MGGDRGRAGHGGTVGARAVRGPCGIAWATTVKTRVRAPCLRYVPTASAASVMNSPRCNAAQNTCTFSLIMCLKNLATNTLIPNGVATTARTWGSPYEQPTDNLPRFKNEGFRDNQHHRCDWFIGAASSFGENTSRLDIPAPPRGEHDHTIRGRQALFLHRMDRRPSAATSSGATPGCNAATTTSTRRPSTWRPRDGCSVSYFFSASSRSACSQWESGCPPPSTS